MPSMDEILLCGDDCVRCGACFGEAGGSCSFEGASVSGGHLDAAMEEEYAKRCNSEPGRDAVMGWERSSRAAVDGSMLDEESLEMEIVDVLERRGFPTYAARSAAEAAVAAALELWQPCRADGALSD